MTTIISLATNNCIVLGCDSLGTVSLPAIRSWDLNNRFFEQDGSPKLDEDGNPIRLSSEIIAELSQSIPYNQIPSVTKIFSIKENGKFCDVGFLFAGLATVGNKSLRTIMGEFCKSKPYKAWKQVRTIPALAKTFSDYLQEEYIKADVYAGMEILISGYSKDCLEPEIQKISIDRGKEPTIKEENKKGEFNVVFGGQYDVIQRVVDGMDFQGWAAINEQVDIACSKYRSKVVEHLAQNGYSGTVPTHNEFMETWELFDYPFKFSRLSSAVRNFSEQAAIDFVEFLVELMIKAQRFSDRIPTVGGDIHIALITPGEGFRWISKEHYKSKDHSVEK